MRPIRDIELRYNPNADLSDHDHERLARVAGGFGDTAAGIIHIITCGEPDGLPAVQLPEDEDRYHECAAAEARAAGHFGLLSLERRPPEGDPDPKTCDVIIENHGSIMLFRPRTGYASDWLRENTDGQWFGGALAVEPRYAGQLVCGIEDAGFSVR